MRQSNRARNHHSSLNCSQQSADENAFALNDDRLTDELVRRVMRWKIAPGRFIKTGRSWIPRWRFEPLNDVSAALQLLQCAAERFCLRSDRGVCAVEVYIRDRCGRASGKVNARTITLAVCRALGIEI